MTKKADFNAEEWSQVLEGPPLAGMIVAVADRGGSLREGISMAKAYVEAQKQHGGSELLDEIVSERPEFERKRFKTPEELHDGGLAFLGEIVQLLETKASSEEVEEYKRFVLMVADTVANARKEGGVLGIGGKPVSDEERAALNEVASTLGLEPPA
jgi:hypothetical protein